MELAKNSEVSASTKWLILAALTCNWQLKLVNFRKFHRCPWASMGHYGTLISLLLINIVGQASIDDYSTICHVSIRRDTYSCYYRR